MRRYFFVFLLTVVASSMHSQSRIADTDFVRAKSKEARELLRQETIGYRTGGVGKKFRIVNRDIMLAAYSPVRDTIDLVHLVVDVPQPKNDFVFRVATSGYIVERLAGRGITRLMFRVVAGDGEELLVLGSRHLHLEHQTIPRDLFYAPFSDDFLDAPREDGFVNEGYKKFFSIIREAKSELCATGAKSKAYPDRLLCIVAPDQWLATLGSIEQTDDAQFFSDSCGVPQCDRREIEKVMVHIARNGESAFGYSISADGARGLMQFMDSARIPTYRSMRKQYKDAGLTADFEHGSAEMKNSIKSAICLLDYHLTQLPSAVRELFLKDPKRGGAFVAAAHNAGFGHAKKMFTASLKNKIDWNTFTLPPRTIPKETIGFIRKYLRTWEILHDVL